MAKPTYKVLNVRKVPLALYRRVKALAEREGHTLTWIVVKALEEYVERRKGGDR